GPEIATTKKIALIRLFGAPTAVVHHDADRVDAVAHGRSYLARGHAKAAVAHQTDDRPPRAAELYAKAASQGETYQTEVKRREQRWWLIVRQLIGRLQAECTGIKRYHRVLWKNRA